MPEITSVETIRAKLREFEYRVDGAMTAASALARIRTDAEKLIVHIEGIEKKSEKADTKLENSFSKVENIRLQLSQLQKDWEMLKQQLENAQGESRKISAMLLSQLDSATQSLARKVAEAEERLKAVNKTSLAEQADLFKRLAASTRANAEIAEKSQSSVAETGARLGGLLRTLRSDLQAEVQDKLASSEKRLESEAQRVEKHLEEVQQALYETVQSRVEDYQRILHEDLLKQLAASTQASTNVAEKAQSLVSDTGARLGGLLRTLRDDLQAEVQGRLTTSEKRLESEMQRIGKNLEQAQSLAHKAETQRIEENIQKGQQALRKEVESKADNYQRLFREEMSAFKADIQRDLVQQDQAIDRRLTDFLNKQNAMVQNLSQQIDSFNRASQAQSADIRVTNTKVSELAVAFDARQEAESKKVLACRDDVAELRALITKTQDRLDFQDRSMVALTKAAKNTSARLDEILSRLRDIPILGGKFK